MAKQGTAVKLLHEGQKVYAIVKTDNAKSVTVAYPFAGQLIERDIPKNECKMPTTKQDDTSFVLLRQIVGIAEESHKKSTPVIAAVGEPMQFKNIPAPAPPTNSAQAMIDSIHKTLGKHVEGYKGFEIEGKAGQPNDKFDAPDTKDEDAAS